MSPHSDTLSGFSVNQFLLFLLNAACSAEKQQIPMFSLWFDPIRARTHDLPHSSLFIEVKLHIYSLRFIPSWSKTALQPIQVSRFFVNAISPPTLDVTTVLTLVWSPPERHSNVNRRWKWQLTKLWKLSETSSYFEKLLQSRALFMKCLIMKNHLLWTGYSYLLPLCLFSLFIWKRL